jgi:hypothetical protein
MKNIIKTYPPLKRTPETPLFPLKYRTLCAYYYARISSFLPYYPAISTMPFHRPRASYYRQVYQDIELDRRRHEYNAQIARYTGRPKNPGNAALPPSQTTIITALNSGLAVRPVRPGPLPKACVPLVPPIKRYMVSGPQEATVLSVFDVFRNPAENRDVSDGSDNETSPRSQRSYPQECKLFAIEYTKYT